MTWFMRDVKDMPASPALVMTRQELNQMILWTFLFGVLTGFALGGIVF